MLTLGDMTVLMLLAAAAAWLWHAHGLRERALELVKQHCTRADVLLLDGAVALRRVALLPDARGRRRLARVYGFEFTVTGEQRHAGSIVLFGRHLGGIELAPYPFDARAEAAVEQAPVLEHPPLNSNVVSLTDWRRHHDQ
ncbi:DUF3301 domain-containing protein [Pseudomonas sp. UL073]|uniref:DUF3301 domain-containing protein n=1 Tax=Zestomonas insulae TaxID=2809017 RepID=A0ABS2IL16_9GAMM|nr:DUF3301 domain-containing protein [Pseudomonas insulae]MBM7063388.1 DUF3301 domain-containing protein [Pseudomonas insulae]